MVTLTDESTWNELESKKENADEEMETCVGVRGVLSHMCSNSHSTTSVLTSDLEFQVESLLISVL